MENDLTTLGLCIAGFLVALLALYYLLKYNEF